jgi:hypothetical protein
MGKVPAAVQVEMAELVQQGLTAKEITKWVNDRGYDVGYQPINRWVRSIEQKPTLRKELLNIASDDDEAFATKKMAYVVGFTDTGEDLIEIAKGKVAAAVKALSMAEWSDLSAEAPDRVITALCRLLSIELQREKQRFEIEQKRAELISQVQAGPDISEETLRLVRERIYGIFDVVEADASN